MSVRRNYWLERATARIRFKGDRFAVRRELEGHLLDREERYIAAGMSPDEAAKAAVADMGDPEEVAQALGRIHAPWWGYLWQLSCWILVIAAISVIAATVQELRPWGTLRTTFPAYTPQTGDITTTAGGREHETLADWEPDTSISLGHYRITVPLAYLEYSGPFTYDSGDTSEGYYILHIWVKATTFRFWEPIAASQSMILERGEAEDSLGRVYGWDPRRDPQEVHSLFCSSYANPLSVWWDVELELPGGELPEWVEIPLGYNGDMIRVDLTAEEVRQ